MKRFWTIFGTAAVVAILLALPRAEAAPSVFFTAMNDQLLPLNTSTIPVVRNGSVYIPYTVFGEQNIGVFISSRTNNTLVLYGRQKILTFDLAAGNAHDLETAYSAQAISQNGTVYVPAYFVSQYFDLEYSYLSTDYGTIIRMKNSDADLNDTAFIKMNTQLMKQYYESYTNPTSKPTSSSTVAPSVTSTPTKTPRPTISSRPSPSASMTPVPSQAEPSPSPLPTELSETMSLSLAVRVTDQSDTEMLLNLFDGKTKAVCFFFSPEELVSQSGLVRRIVGSGYGIGFYVTSGESSLESSLEQGNQLLSEIARTTTLLVAGPNLSEAQRSALTKKGYVIFLATEVIGDEEESASVCRTQMNQAIGTSNGKARLLLSDGPEVRNALISLMDDWGKIEEHLYCFSETNR